MSVNDSVMSGSGYCVLETGVMAEWSQPEVLHPALGLIQGKRFLKEALQLTGVEISLNTLEAGEVVGFLHSHKQNEEIYLFLTGQGEMLLDSQRIPVRAGSVVRVDPPVARSWRNTGTETMHYLVIQAKAHSLEQWTRTDGERRGGNPWI